MGLLLTISLTTALLCTLFVLPALLGPDPPAAVQPAASDPHRIGEAHQLPRRDVGDSERRELPPRRAGRAG
jgi:hypothetical protein